MGQFIQPDSLIPEPYNPISLNRYAYAYNSPVNYTDSSGHFIDTLWDVLDLGVDLHNCLGDTDSLSCYMLPVDILAVAAVGVPGPKGIDNAARLPKHGVDYLGPVGGYVNQKRLNDWASLRRTQYHRLEDVPYAPTLKELTDKGKLVEGENYLYAIDLRGNLRLATEADLVASSIPHHSFLVKGENVFGAGHIRFKSSGDNIVVESVNPLTGHYIPPQEAARGIFKNFFGSQFRGYLNRLLTDEYGLKIGQFAYNRLLWVPLESFFGVTMSTDDEILTSLIEKIGITPQVAEYTDDGCLVSLEFSNSGITALPSEIGKLANLCSLSLHNNRLKQLPSDIICLVNLEVLDLSDNYFTELPSDFSKLANLRALSLSNNQLRGLPPNFAKLTKLQALELWKNRLSHLPFDFNQMTHLELLWIDSDLLSYLSEEFKQNVRVTTK